MELLHFPGDIRQRINDLRFTKKNEGRRATERGEKSAGRWNDGVVVRKSEDRKAKSEGRLGEGRGTRLCNFLLPFVK